MQTVAVIPVLPHGVVQLGSSSAVSTSFSTLGQFEIHACYINFFVYMLSSRESGVNA